MTRHLEEQLRLARIDEAHHRKQMEYQQETIQILTTELDQYRRTKNGKDKIRKKRQKR